MNSWRARVEYNPLSREYEVSAIRPKGHGDDVVVGADEFGALIVHNVEPGMRVDPFLRIPEELMEAIVEALQPHRPPDPDRHLVEALAHERRRVDNVLDRLIPDPMSGYFPMTAQSPEA